MREFSLCLYTGGGEDEREPAAFFIQLKCKK